MTVTFIQLTAVLVVILLAIAFVLLSWNWAEWSDARRRAGIPSWFSRWRRRRRAGRVTVTPDTTAFVDGMKRAADATRRMDKRWFS